MSMEPQGVVWGPNASKRPVRVTYRVKGQNAVTTRTMSHKDYWEWQLNMRVNGYELVRAEQVREA